MQFGKGRIFKDIDSIPLGLDFRKVLTERIAGCEVFLAVIGDDWLSITGQGGTRRLDDPVDFVRIEIEAALSRKIPVIPVLVGNSPVPKAEELPESLRELSFRHGLLVRPDPDFHNDMDRLVRGIEDVVSGSPRRRAHAIWPIAIAASLFGSVALGVIVVTIKTKIAVPDVSSIPVDPDGKIAEHGLSKNGPASGAKPTADASGAKIETPTAAPKRTPPVGPARLAQLSGGPWAVDGDQLVKEGLGGGLVRFGGESWSDYDLTFELNKTAGSDSLGAHFRVGAQTLWVEHRGPQHSHPLSSHSREGNLLRDLEDSRHDPSARVAQGKDLLAGATYPRRA